MLLCIRQFIENVKWMRQALATLGIVRLQAFNDCSGLIRYVVQPVSVFDLPVEYIARVANREQNMNWGLAIR